MRFISFIQFMLNRDSPFCFYDYFLIHPPFWPLRVFSFILLELYCNQKSWWLFSFIIKVTMFKTILPSNTVDIVWHSLKHMLEYFGCFLHASFLNYSIFHTPKNICLDIFFSNILSFDLVILSDIISVLFTF